MAKPSSSSNNNNKKKKNRRVKWQGIWIKVGSEAEFTKIKNWTPNIFKVF